MCFFLFLSCFPSYVYLISLLQSIWCADLCTSLLSSTLALHCCLISVLHSRWARLQIRPHSTLQEEFSPKQVFMKVAAVVGLFVDESDGLQRTLDTRFRPPLGLPRPVVKERQRGGCKQKCETSGTSVLLTLPSRSFVVSTVTYHSVRELKGQQTFSFALSSSTLVLGVNMNTQLANWFLHFQTQWDLFLRCVFQSATASFGTPIMFYSKRFEHHRNLKPFPTRFTCIFFCFSSSKNEEPANRIKQPAMAQRWFQRLSCFFFQEVPKRGAYPKTLLKCTTMGAH